MWFWLTTLKRNTNSSKRLVWWSKRPQMLTFPNRSRPFYIFHIFIACCFILKESKISHLCHKNYFVPKAFEFLKSLLCLKAEPPQRTQLPINPLPRSSADLFLETRSPHTQTDIATKPSCLPSILLKVHLSFKMSFVFPWVPFWSPSKRSFALPKGPLCPSPFPKKMVHQLQIRTPTWVTFLWEVPCVHT